MTEWWLRKAVICHLSPIFCNYYFIRDGIPTSPLTRSVGSVTSPYFSPFFYLFIFQLTRSVGSVTTNRPMTSRAMQISTHTLRGERDSTYCICEVTPPQQSGHFTKNHFKKRYFLHNMYYFFSEPPYKTNITARSLTKSNCPQGHMFPLHLYAPLSSSNYYPNNRIEGYLVLHQ